MATGSISHVAVVGDVLNRCAAVELRPIQVQQVDAGARAGATRCLRLRDVETCCWLCRVDVLWQPVDETLDHAGVVNTLATCRRASYDDDDRAGKHCSNEPEQGHDNQGLDKREASIPHAGRP
jgi:hypothetical protein